MPFLLPSTVNQETALQLEKEGLFNLPALTSVDCSHLNCFDSSVLTVLLSWQMKLQAAQKQLLITNAPEKLKVLASVYGVSALLGL
jgi:phospholipid transport system transporter-binding protein